MKKVEAINELNKAKGCPILNDSHREAIDTAISAIKLIGHLNNRPCEACEFHKENGCCKWICVFDDLIYEKTK